MRFVEFGRKKNLVSHDYYIGEIKIKKSHQIRDQGVLFDDKITFFPHIENNIEIQKAFETAILKYFFIIASYEAS